MSEQELQAISSEQAFDMLPYVVDIYEKLSFDKHIKTIQNKYKGKKNVDPIYPAIDATKYILKNSGKVKDEFFAIVSIASHKPVDEVKKQSYIETIRSVKRIFSDPELMDFFKQAME